MLSMGFNSRRFSFCIQKFLFHTERKGIVFPRLSKNIFLYRPRTRGERISALETRKRDESTTSEGRLSDNSAISPSLSLRTAFGGANDGWRQSKVKKLAGKERGIRGPRSAEKGGNKNSAVQSAKDSKRQKMRGQNSARKQSVKLVTDVFVRSLKKSLGEKFKCWE